MIIYLPLVTSALLLGWYLFGGNSSQPPSPADIPVAERSAAPTPLISPTTGPSRALPAPVEQPTSLRGTDIDGQLEVDGIGNLRITGQVRHLFDYFLSLIGEEDLAATERRIRDHLAGQLQQPALGQALALLDDYLEYQRQVAELESRFPVSENPEDLLAREQAVQQLRASLFSREAHEAFFAGEEIYNNFTLERLIIARDDFMDERQKAEAVEALRESLPEEMQQLLVPQLHQELREQTLALRDAGADEHAIRALRMNLLGPAATERLEELDAQRAEWRQRVASFERERDAIMAQPGLAATDRQAAVDALMQEQFSESERLRLR